MQQVESFNLPANQWSFLSNPQEYVAASTDTERPLILASTRRQFNTARDILARLSGSCGEQQRLGILLADDVGLGKTTVGALVAWVIASAGEKRSVRILAPNDVMARRWRDELKAHVKPLGSLAPELNAQDRRVKDGRVGKLSAGSIQVVKHSYALNSNLKCDLLIIDEAHRAKGETTEFSKALVQNRKLAKRVLILTATPFSIRLEELQRMLKLIGAEAAIRPVEDFSKALDTFYSEHTTRSVEKVAGNRLADKAIAAVEALSSFVIRHGIDDLEDESKAFGVERPWPIDVPQATSEELELILRMDRALRVAKNERSEHGLVTNDPRFHVGWRHLDEMVKSLQAETPSFAELSTKVVDNHFKAIRLLRQKSPVHPKMAAVAREVGRVIEQGDKVLLFCHHHATAQELTSYLASKLPNATALPSLARPVWEKAWDEILNEADEEDDNDALREVFIDWLCTDMIRSQTWAWFGTAQPTSLTTLVRALTSTMPRNPSIVDGARRDTIAKGALHLYRALVLSKSSKAILQLAAKDPGRHPLPGTSRVVGYCKLDQHAEEEGNFFIHNQEPDTIIAIFNSPFGPDVLVVTDRLSEGIDLHHYCRHLIHYELDPSPIRTVQRNGRIRRINSWAAVTGQPIQYAYPAFGGTRDQQLVWIMQKRIACFSLLLGGVRDFDVNLVDKSDEEWRKRVIDIAKAELAKAGGRLRANRGPEEKSRT